MKQTLPLAVLLSLPPTPPLARPLFAQAPAAPATPGAPATPPAATNPAGQRRAPRPIVLNPDDKPAFPDPPAGFNVKRDGIPHGKLEMVEYDSKTVGTRRKM